MMKILPAIALTLCLNLGLFVPAIAGEQPVSTSTMWEVSDLIAEGRKEMRRGNPEKALPLFERARQLNPNFATAIALVAQAKAYRLQKDNFLLHSLAVTDALVRGAKSPKISPDSNYYHAKEVAREAIKLNPSDPDALIAFAMVERAILDIDEMEKSLLKLSTPQDSRSLVLWGVVHFYRIRFHPKSHRHQLATKAQECFQNAIAIDPELFDARYGLGEVYEFLGRDDDAKDLARALIRINPSQSEGYRMLIELARKTNDQSTLVEAQSLIEHSIFLSPAEKLEIDF